MAKPLKWSEFHRYAIGMVGGHRTGEMFSLDNWTWLQLRALYHPVLLIEALLMHIDGFTVQYVTVCQADNSMADKPS